MHVIWLQRPYYSEKTAAVIDDEIRSIIAEAYERCKKYLSENIEKLHFVANFLLKYETMDQEQFEAAMSSEAPTFEEIENIANEKKRKSEQENKTAHENNAKAEEEARKKAEAEAAEAKRRMEQGENSDTSDFFDIFWREQQKFHSDNNGESDDKNVDKSNNNDDLDNTDSEQ